MSQNLKKEKSKSFFLDGLFQAKSIQRMLFQVTETMNEPFSFGCYQSIYQDHGLRLAETTVRESKASKLAETGFPNMFGDKSESAFDGLEPGPKRYYVNLLVNELTGGQLTGPLHCCMVFLWYCKLHPAKDSKIGVFWEEDVLNLIKCTLSYNTLNVRLNMAQESARPGITWFRQTVELAHQKVKIFLLFKKFLRT